MPFVKTFNYKTHHMWYYVLKSWILNLLVFVGPMFQSKGFDHDVEQKFTTKCQCHLLRVGTAKNVILVGSGIIQITFLLFRHLNESYDCDALCMSPDWAQRSTTDTLSAKTFQSPPALIRPKSNSKCNELPCIFSTTTVHMLIYAKTASLTIALSVLSQLCRSLASASRQCSLSQTVAGIVKMLLLPMDLKWLSAETKAALSSRPLFIVYRQKLRHI